MSSRLSSSFSPALLSSDLPRVSSTSSLTYAFFSSSCLTLKGACSRPAMALTLFDLSRLSYSLGWFSEPLISTAFATSLLPLLDSYLRPLDLYSFFAAWALTFNSCFSSLSSLSFIDLPRPCLLGDYLLWARIFCFSFLPLGERPNLIVPCNSLYLSYLSAALIWFSTMAADLPLEIDLCSEWDFLIWLFQVSWL